MATWAGWEAQFLNAAGLIVTPPNMALLNQWSQNAHTSCRNNPIDLSHNLVGSTQCGALPGIFPHARNYTSHAQAATAFADEVRSSFAAKLYQALNSGNPYQVSFYNDVASVFVSWGSDKMLNVYLTTATGPAGNPNPPGSKKADLLDGWHSLRRSLNRNWRPALHAAERDLHTALRSLSRSHKVRL